MTHLARLLLWRRPSFHQNCFSIAAPSFFLTSLSQPGLISNSGVEVLHFAISWNSSPLSLSFRLFPFRNIRLFAPPPRKDISPGEDPNKVSKSRNQRKREFQVVERFGEILARFHESRIETITSLIFEERHVACITFEALMLGKKLLHRESSKVREGRRRHFKYIGGLLLKANPHVLHDLILSTRKGDEETFRSLCLQYRASAVEKSVQEEVTDDESELEIVEDNNEWESVDENSENEIIEESSGNEIIEDNNVKNVVEDHSAGECEGPRDKANRWFNGLIRDDIDITEEVFAIYDVDFDREELSRLIHKMKSFRHDKSNGARMEKQKTQLFKFLEDIAHRIDDI